MGDRRLQPGAVFAEGFTQSSVERVAQFARIVGRRHISQDAIRRLGRESRESLETHSNMGRINASSTVGESEFSCRAMAPEKEVNLSLNAVLQQVETALRQGVVQDVTSQGQVGRDGCQSAEVLHEELIRQATERQSR